MLVYQYKWELAALRRLFPLGRELRDPGALEGWDCGEVRHLFLHPRSGGHGLNLQKSGCGLVIFVGPIWSRDGTDQVVGRVARRGGAARVSVMVLVMDATVETKVMLPRLAGKADGARQFRDHISSMV